MSESPPPAKRVRLDSYRSPTPSTTQAPLLPPPLDAFKRHDRFWFDDGNLILVANKDTAFRVYCGLLAAQSTVFADMLAAARSDPSPLVDGCLVLEVSDTPVELAHFTNIILPNSQPVFHRRIGGNPLSVTFDQVAAITRLAHKYKVEDVREQGLALLQQGHYPIDYLAWSHRDLHPTIRMEKANAIGAVNLARYIGALSLLPMAVYGCIRLGSAVLDGWKRDDGVVEYLTPADLKYCMDVRDRLARESAIAFARGFKWVEPYKGCTTPAQCRSRLRTARREVFAEHFTEHLILDDWEPDLEYLLDEYGLCCECSGEIAIREYHERDKVWDKLPDVLGIEVEGWGLVPSCIITF